ncbi:MAG TPA: ATP-grasp domain-containing protein [Longimicrobium sp.]|jgi:cysteine synthase A|uniref:ATP-grasp domain-containing protein n=1 Tax=Longimicrobium sp. TaxID=2029185 RepID=UPI002ED8FD30
MTPPHLFLFLSSRDEVAVAMLKAAARTGAQVSVMSDRAPEFFVSYPFVRHVVTPVRGGDDAGWEAAARRLEQIHAAEPFVRVVPSSEGSVEFAARLNQHLGLGGNSPETAAASRDKFRMRRALAAHGGALIPEFRLVSSWDEFQAAVEAVGYPCISKPIRAAASDGVAKIEDASQVRAAWEFTSAVPQIDATGTGTVLVESYASGPEYSVEGIVSNGVAHILGVTEKTTEAEPFFNEIMHVFPAPISAEAETAMRRTAQAVAEGLGMTGGAMHLEVRLNARGPVVMECAARLAGDSVPIIARFATGVDIYEQMLNEALGRPVCMDRRTNRVSGIRFVQSPREGVLEGFGFDRVKLAAARGVVGHGPVRRAGDMIARPPRGATNRVGWVMAVGATAGAVRATLAAGEDAARYTLEGDAPVAVAA